MTDWHDNYRFAQLLRRAATISSKAQAVQQELTEAFRARYGKTYSDVDADQIIDVLDYGGGAKLTYRECDRLMADCGAPYGSEEQ